MLIIRHQQVFNGCLKHMFSSSHPGKLSLYLYLMSLRLWSCQPASLGRSERERQLSPARKSTWLRGAFPGAGGVRPKGWTKFGYWNCGLQKPKAVPKDTVGRCPRCDIATTTTLCSISSVGTVVPPPEAIAMRTHHHHHHGKNPCDMTLDFFCYLLPNMRQLKQFALSPFKLTSSSCQMALSLFCKKQHTDGTEGLCSGSTTVPLH